jgi:hypothetical protein
VIKRNYRLIALRIGYTCEWAFGKERSFKRNIERIDRGRGYFEGVE